MDNSTVLDNLAIYEKSDSATLSINPKIFPLDLVYAAAYIMIDKAFIMLDGDPNERIIVQIQRKNKADDLKDLAVAFNEELLNYAVYKTQSEKNKSLREIILQRVLLTNNQGYSPPPAITQTSFKDSKKIFQSWEERHANEDKQNQTEE